MSANSWRRCAGVFMSSVAVAVVLGLTSATAAPPVRGASGCPMGLSEKEWVCLTIQEAADVRLREINLRERLAVLEARRGVGWHFGCGPGIGVVATEDWSLKAAPVLACAAVYGW